MSQHDVVHEESNFAFSAQNTITLDSKEIPAFANFLGRADPWQQRLKGSRKGNRASALKDGLPSRVLATVSVRSSVPIPTGVSDLPLQRAIAATLGDSEQVGLRVDLLRTKSQEEEA